MEFSPEIAAPLCIIYNNIIQSSLRGVAQWPKQWKIEHGTPIKKIDFPLTEDDLRIISLTPFVSKVFERFVVMWLRTYIGHQLDPKQFGDSKGNSTSHYMIELINFVLSSQDQDPPKAA